MVHNGTRWEKAQTLKFCLTDLIKRLEKILLKVSLDFNKLSRFYYTIES